MGKKKKGKQEKGQKAKKTIRGTSSGTRSSVWNKKNLLFALKIFVILVVCFWICRKLYFAWDVVQKISWQPDYGLLAFAGLCYAAAYIPAAFFWRLSMQSLGQTPGLYETLRAYYIGHLGKYVIGKAFVLIIRSGLLDHSRTTLSASAASVFLETMTMMAVGAFAAAVMVLYCGISVQEYSSGFIALAAAGVAAATMLPILPPVLRFAAKFVAKKYQDEIGRLRFRTLAVGWLLNIPVWIMLGVFLWLTMLGFGMKSESPLAEIPFCILVASIAVVLGFISMLPAGLGAREVVMALILTQYILQHPILPLPEPEKTDPKQWAELQALVIVALQRVISIAAELAVAACFWKKRV
ncbi:MAG: flippase-like domain-containing protein [Planctomycetaceae bacterium]|jgi:uncharacterized membrane protein YbhN (UPF0104 family)|nr:flippase-like domain-containing protein [Planctomycetaceae bacterium]